MENAICNVAAAPMRAEPAHRSEMSNQLLFGETMQILEKKEEWLRVKTEYDEYEGWITHHLIQHYEPGTITEPWRFVATGLVNPVTLGNQLINAPMGSFLTGYNEDTRNLWNENYKYHGTLKDTKLPAVMDYLWKISHAWLNSPYLWGGKTFMGVDCSGFVQTVFKLMGKKIPRDAWQQAMEGKEVKNREEAKTGDLAFFHNDKGRITHVALVLQPNQVIHASGKVRVDILNDSGIINSGSGSKTHDFNCIRRFF
jgi:gamma-D-glutamyl-L-lysine dipeptidyl-peptidase